MYRIPKMASLALLVWTVACAGRGDDTGTSMNSAPVSNAGADQAISADESVTLDGRASYDAEGDDLVYQWAFDRVPEGSGLSDMDKPFTRNNSDQASTTTFSPDAVGTFIVSLVVSDGKLESPPDFVIVTTEEPDSQPVANAGTDQVSAEGANVILDGTGSYDPEGRDLSYAWAAVQTPSGSVVTGDSLTDSETATPSFTVDVRGIYVFNLVVHNGLSNSEADAVVITAMGDDNSPVANAGEDLEAEDCSAIALSGANSLDPDGDALTYFWELQYKPATSAADNDSFSDRGAAEPTFWADVSGAYGLSLSVSDGTNWSLADPMVLTVAERASNTPPTITLSDLGATSAGEAECAESGYTYECDDCPEYVLSLGSHASVVDAEGDPYTLKWELTTGDGSFSDDTSIDSTVTLTGVTTSEPYYCAQNAFVLKLTATDCTEESTNASMNVVLECCGIEATGSR